MSDRDRIIAEVAKVPDEKLGEIYSLVHRFSTQTSAIDVHDPEKSNRLAAVRVWLKTACGAARAGVTTAELQRLTRDGE